MSPGPRLQVVEVVAEAPTTMQADVEKVVEASHGRESEGAGRYAGGALVLLRPGPQMVVSQVYVPQLTTIGADLK